MTQDNDPWGNNPRNTEGNELGSLLSKLKDSFLGGSGGSSENQQNGESPRNSSSLPNFSGKAVAPILAVAALGWISTGIYILPEGFHGVELTFGKYSETATQPGFNLRKPYPIGAVEKVDIGSLKNLSVGSTNGNTEGQMLTSDENIVEVSLSVQYKIGDASKYLFNVNEPEKVLKETLISSIREVVGASTVDYVLTDGRAEWPAKVRANLVETLNGFDVGFDIARVELREAKAPKEVQEAFDDAVKAREDAERYKLQAEAYQNKEVPLARGKAQQIIEKALGDKAEVIAKATGEASRFDAILKSYQLAPAVTRDRMYIETLETVYSNVNNVVVATGDSMPMMYLPVGQGTSQQIPLVPPLAEKEKTTNHPVADKKYHDAYGEIKITTPKVQERLTR